MSYLIPQPIREETPTFVFFKKFMKNEDCEQIVDLQHKIQSEEGKISAKKEKRMSDVRWIHHAAEVESLFQVLADGVARGNAEQWHFNINGFVEPLQLSRYKDGGHYDWHEDRYDRGIGIHRKISGTLLLNDQFEGGEFELFDTDQTPKMERGDLILFPSYKVHRVKPITSGERWSLVFWVFGPPFV